MSFIVIHCHSLSFIVIHRHSSSFIVIHRHSSSFVVIRRHSSSFVVIRRHSSSFVVIRRHSFQGFRCAHPWLPSSCPYGAAQGRSLIYWELFGIYISVAFCLLPIALFDEHYGVVHVLSLVEYGFAEGGPFVGFIDALAEGDVLGEGDHVVADLVTASE